MALTPNLVTYLKRNEYRKPNVFLLMRCFQSLRYQNNILAYIKGLLIYDIIPLMMSSM